MSNKTEFRDTAGTRMLNLNENYLKMSYLE